MKCGLGVRETFPRPDASPPRCAQLMGLALRGCLVLVLGATAERRNLLFRSDLGLPWIRTFRSTPPIQVKQQNELRRAFNGHLADPHQFLFAHTVGRIDSIDADIARHRRADRGASGPFLWKTILDTRVLIAEHLGAAPTPLVLAQVEC